MERLLPIKFKLILFCLIFFIYIKCNAQIIDYNAIDEVIIADSLYDTKQYNEAIRYYKKVLGRHFFSENEIYQMISFSYYYLLEKDSSLKYMVKSIQSGKHYWLETSITRDKTTLEILSYDSSGIFLQQLESNTRKFLSSSECLIYQKLADSLKICKQEDQLYRSIGKKKTDEEWLSQKNIDLKNRNYLLLIIKKINKWPGYKEVGREGESTVYLIAQHSEDSIFQLQCLLLMKEALLINNMNPSHYGLLVDRYLLLTKGYQVFGTQIEMINKEGQLIAQPKKKELFNEKYSNTLRSYFNMPSLDLYLEQMTEMNNKNNDNGTNR